MNRPRVLKRAVALRDLEEISEYIRQDSPRAALRFLQAAERSFGLLAGEPLMGRAYEAEDPRLAALRCFRIAGFESYLIFYQPALGGIEVVRVIHGARDIPTVLEEME
jgi:toxin ParE1/3/4